MAAEDPFAPRAREANAYQPIDLPPVSGTMSLTGDVLVHSAEVASTSTRRVPWAELPAEPQAFDATRQPAPVPLGRTQTTSPPGQWLDEAFEAPKPVAAQPAPPELSWPPRLVSSEGKSTTYLGSPPTNPGTDTPSQEGAPS